MIRNLQKIILMGVLLLSAGMYATDQERSSMKEEKPLTREKSLVVFIDYGNGYIDLRKTESENIYEGEFIYEEYRPDVRYEIVGDEGRLNIHFSGKLSKSGEEDERKNISSLNKLYDNELLLSFNEEVPLSLDMELGVIKGDMDLSGLNVRDIDIEVGVSQARIYFDEPNPILMEQFNLEGGVGKLYLEKLGNSNMKEFNFEGGVGSYELDFSGEYHHDIKANIEMGMGKMKLYLPRRVGTRIAVEKSFLTSLSIDDVYKKDDIYYNDMWDKTSHHLDIDLETGVGKIDIVWID